VCWKFSSSGPRFVHMSDVCGSWDDSAGVQCAAEGVKIAAGAASATIVVANSEAADVKSILNRGESDSVLGSRIPRE
jgi:hypothetical protein